MLEYVAAAAPASPPTDNPVLFWLWTVVLVAWCFFAIGAGRFVKLYRRDSIVGPERLGHAESGGVLIAILCLGVASAELLGSLATRLAGDRFSQEGRTVVLTSIIYGVGFVVLIAFSRLARGADSAKLGLQPSRFAIGLLGGAIAFTLIDPFVQGSNVIVSQIYAHLQEKPPTHEVLKLMGETKKSWIFWVSCLGAWVLAPCTEELVFRGMLQTALGRFFAVAGGRGRPHAGSNVLEDQTSPGVAVGTAAGPRWAAVITTSLLFAAVHGQVAFFVPLFVLSAGLGFLYERTGNLWSTITVHSLFNLINTLLFLYSTN